MSDRAGRYAHGRGRGGGGAFGQNSFDSQRSARGSGYANQNNQRHHDQYASGRVPGGFPNSQVGGGRGGSARGFSGSDPRTASAGAFPSSSGYGISAPAGAVPSSSSSARDFFSSEPNIGGPPSGGSSGLEIASMQAQLQEQARQLQIVQESMWQMQRELDELQRTMAAQHARPRVPVIEVSDSSELDLDAAEADEPGFSLADARAAEPQEPGFSLADTRAAEPPSSRFVHRHGQEQVVEESAASPIREEEKSQRFR